jgi:hypothetical protein
MHIHKARSVENLSFGEAAEYLQAYGAKVYLYTGTTPTMWVSVYHASHGKIVAMVSGMTGLNQDAVLQYSSVLNDAAHLIALTTKIQDAG